MTDHTRPAWPHSISAPLVNPIQPSVVYRAPSPDALDAQYAGETQGFTYAREGHPNASALAGMIDRMEGAEGGLITGSGMAAVSAVFLGCLKQGDHVIGGDQLYGRTLRLMSQDLPRLGIETTLADSTDLAAMRAALRPNTRMIVIEIVSNPTLRLADFAGLVALAREAGVLLVVDNTFTTPRALQPLAQGADIVLHSVTKLLAGHSDATLGYVAARDAALRQQISDLAVTMGLTASPFDCWLAERGLLSFDLRYDRAQANATALAAFLGDHPGVARVLYPGRADHPDHNRAAPLLRENTGNMVSFEINGGRAAANALVQACPEIAFAPTLGDVSTTLSHPASSSHRGLSPEERAALGISEGFFRVSVGIEAEAALIAAFDRALSAASG